MYWGQTDKLKISDNLPPFSHLLGANPTEEHHLLTKAAAGAATAACQL